jgi:hypothetical protein
MQANISIENLKVENVWFNQSKIFFDLAQGLTVGAPLHWFPRLAKATDEQRSKWRLIANGLGVHWEEIDEDLSAEGMFTFQKN